MLYYSFNVKVNDSIILSVSTNSATVDTLYNQVKKIDSVKIGEIYYKRVFVDCPAYSPFFLIKHVWIEGIGGMEGIISSSYPPADFITTLQLLCLSNKDSLVYNPDTGIYNNCFYWNHSAYTYHPFPTKNTVWMEYYYPVSGYGNQKPHSHCFALKNTDTTINGNLYHKMYHSTDTIFPEDSLCGAIREVNKQVFYYSFRQLNYYNMELQPDSEVMIYDFSVDLGDIVWSKLHPVTWLTGECQVDSVDSILIGLDYRRRYIFGTIYFFKTIMLWAQWVEGIGSLRGVFYKTGDYLDNGLWNDLVCFWQDGKLLYHNSQYSQCFYASVSVGTKYLDEISIYPNPATKTAYIKTGNGQYKVIELYNAYGIMVGQYIMNRADDFSINVEGFAPGFYLMVFKGSGIPLKVVKFVIK